jgi:hypothetical protein
MTQPMTGKASTPIARSNAPVSIFAEEKQSMASRKHAAQQSVAAAATPETVAPVAVKPAKAPKVVAAPTQSPLELVIAQQTKRVDNAILRHFANRVSARTQAGQPQAAAVTEVFAQYAQAVAALATAAAAATAPTAAKAPIGEVAAEQVERLHAQAEAAAADADTDAKAAEFTAEQPAN